MGHGQDASTTLDPDLDAKETRELMDQMSLVVSQLAQPSEDGLPGDGGDDPDDAHGKIMKRYEWFENIYSFIMNWPKKTDEEKEELIKSQKDAMAAIS